MFMLDRTFLIVHFFPFDCYFYGNCNQISIQGIFEIVEQVIRYNLVWVSLRLINRETIYEKRKLTQSRLCKYNLFNNFKYSL